MRQRIKSNTRGAIMERFRATHGDVPLAAVVYRRRTYDLFFSGKKAAARRRRFIVELLELRFPVFQIGYCTDADRRIDKVGAPACAHDILGIAYLR